MLSVSVPLVGVRLMALIDHRFIGSAPQCSMLPLEIFTAVKAASARSH